MPGCTKRSTGKEPATLWPRPREDTIPRTDGYGEGAGRSYAVLIDPLVGRLRTRITRICQSRGAANALDIACATGAQCRSLTSAGIEATGIDLSESMIATARRSSPESIRYSRASAFDLPFSEGSFDAAILSLALHEHPEAERVIMVREALRVLRPHGTLILAEYHRPPHSFCHLPWQAIRVIEWLAGGEHHAGFADFMRGGGLDGALQRYGLSAVVRASSHFGAIGIAAVTAIREPGSASGRHPRGGESSEEPANRAA